MHIDRLRLVGFKSFVDATELVIEPGLTGVVGPNGCGKSNLVEALRWVMGESSARRLRGGEMDDVIFGGTAGRPARNLAEVALTIDNSARNAPFAFNDRETIEIVRRIERGAGSSYRVNGQEARARDVQLLFADAATGANSGAMVNQGRVGALIAAKPAERRVLLDEAAGTAGLHARRHEAELKLKAAEDNLLRLDDVIATMTSQFEGLKRQARQAQRYRRLAEQIRRMEAQLLRARWGAAETEAGRIAADLRVAERAVAAATERDLADQRARAEAEAALPPLRLAEAAAAAALQRLTHAREALEHELKRVLAARADGERRRAQLDADLRREDERLADADAALDRLAEERRALECGDRDDGPARDSAAAELREATAALADAETGLRQATEASGISAARRAVLERQRRDLTERAARLRNRLAEHASERAALTAALVPAAAAAGAAAAVAEAERQVERGRLEVEASAQALAARIEHETTALDAARDSEIRLARAKAEAEAIEKFLAASTKSAGAAAGEPILSALRVEEGFEAAVGALFEDELAAPLVERDGNAAPRGWVELAPLADGAPLPPGARPLAAAVGAPAALDRRLAQAGWVETEAAGWQLQGRLAAGQTLVDRAGRMWRWDGFTRMDAGPSVAAQHLQHRNRLAVLAAAVATVEAERGDAERQAAAARAVRQQAAESDRAVQRALRETETALACARTAEAELARRTVAAETRLAALVDGAERLAADLAESTAQTAEAERGLAALPGVESVRDALDAAQARAVAARGRDGVARVAIDRLTREADLRRQRLAALALEQRSWQQRKDGSAAQRASLAERRRALAEEIAALAARPAAIAAESEALGSASADAAASRRDAGDALATGETGLREANERARQAGQALAEAREQRTRLAVLRDGAEAALTRLRSEIRERIDAAPEGLADLVDDDMAAPDAVATATRLERLLREREAIGPVNLVAEAEAAEIEMRVAGLQRERSDLTEAIARLRRGIAALDQEGRKRLVAAFERLNEHFATLFSRLFGGGQAHLTLADDGDPLAAGLEIMASPPGKRLQALSLLSGGEQALAAIALLFAVFMTNPAPVCILDEVDAPLDDANVDRFCSVVAETADATGTRFLLITHHRVTMARMDRLYGVTMRERGISQLVSVDLVRAARLRQSA